MVLYLLSQAEANANAKRVSATDNPYLAQIAQARAATIDGSLSSHGGTRPGRTPVYLPCNSRASRPSPFDIQARVAAVNQVAREEREALSAAADAEGEDELRA